MKETEAEFGVKERRISAPFRATPKFMARVTFCHVALSTTIQFRTPGRDHSCRNAILLILHNAQGNYERSIQANQHGPMPKVLAMSTG
jgi:hypothetical protein